MEDCSRNSSLPLQSLDSRPTRTKLSYCSSAITLSHTPRYLSARHLSRNFRLILLVIWKRALNLPFYSQTRLIPRTLQNPSRSSRYLCIPSRLPVCLESSVLPVLMLTFFSSVQTRNHRILFPNSMRFCSRLIARDSFYPASDRRTRFQSGSCRRTTRATTSSRVLPHPVGVNPEMDSLSSVFLR